MSLKRLKLKIMKGSILALGIVGLSFAGNAFADEVRGTRSFGGISASWTGIAPLNYTLTTIAVATPSVSVTANENARHAEVETKLANTATVELSTGRIGDHTGFEIGAAYMAPASSNRKCDGKRQYEQYAFSGFADGLVQLPGISAFADYFNFIGGLGVGLGFISLSDKSATTPSGSCAGGFLFSPAPSGFSAANPGGYTILGESVKKLAVFYRAKIGISALLVGNDLYAELLYKFSGTFNRPVFERSGFTLPTGVAGAKAKDVPSVSAMFYFHDVVLSLKKKF